MLKKLYAMITRKMEHKFEELKIYFYKKSSSQEQSLTCTFHPLINDLKANITKEIKREVCKQHEKLVSQNKILQQQVSELCKLNLDSVKNLFELAEVNIPDVVLDRRHRTGCIF